VSGGDRLDQAIGPVGKTGEHELSIEMEHLFGMRRVTADRKVCLAVRLPKIGVRRRREAIPESVDHDIAAEGRRCDDESTDSARLADGQLHPDLTAVAKPENIERPDRELLQQCCDTVGGTLERGWPAARSGTAMCLSGAVTGYGDSVWRVRKSVMTGPMRCGCVCCTACPAWLTMSTSAPGMCRFIVSGWPRSNQGSSSPVIHRVGWAIRARSAGV